jgi:flavin-dependent dehydrogenase
VDLDLAIVGGGPAGVATALFLASAAPHLKDRIAVLEKERYPREKICAGAIGARADRLLASIGVQVDVPSAHVTGFSIATPRSLRAVRREAPVGRVVRRIEFDRALADEAKSRGIRVLEGTRVTGLDVDEGGVRVSSTAGELRARAVIGADGVGSFVRRSLGLPRGQWHAQVVEVDTPAADDDPARDFLHFDITDRSLIGYAWDFPTVVDGRPLVCRGIYELRPDDRLASDVFPAPPPEGDLGERLLARVRRAGLADKVRIKRYAERGLALHEPVARPRVLLVGEAAGIDPALGEGIAQAIFYGAAAGEYLARRLDRDDLSFHDWPRALRRSQVGFDLRLRNTFVRWVYGRTRPLMERWITGSDAFMHAGMKYFAGERIPLSYKLKTTLALGSAYARHLYDRFRA